MLVSVQKILILSKNSLFYFQYNYNFDPTVITVIPKPDIFYEFIPKVELGLSYYF